MTNDVMWDRLFDLADSRDMDIADMLFRIADGNTPDVEVEAITGPLTDSGIEELIEDLADMDDEEWI